MVRTPWNCSIALPHSRPEIFQGARPADLPVEVPTRYLFVINTKTAKAMDFAVPNNVLSLADEVIE